MSKEYHVVTMHDGSIKRISRSDDPLASLRETFSDCSKTREELRDLALETALDEAGR